MFLGFVTKICDKGDDKMRKIDVMGDKYGL